MVCLNNPVSCASLLKKQDGSALLEFAIALPLLVVFIVGIFDFSGAFNSKLKIQHAAQLGAIVAATQPTVSNAGLQWTYAISGCPDTLNIVINRSATAGSGPVAVASTVQVQYPYHWRFNSAIQLLFPGASYAAVTPLTETATVHNQT